MKPEEVAHLIAGSLTVHVANDGLGTPLVRPLRDGDYSNVTVDGAFNLVAVARTVLAALTHSRA